MSGVAECQAHPKSASVVNVGVPEILAQIGGELKIPFVFISTDLVFDGKQAPYDEDQATSPVCVYGEQKAEAESKVLEYYPEALVCRSPLLFGLAPYSENHFSVQMLDAIARQQSMRLFVDEFRTPVDNRSLARGILSLIGKTSGILHLGGKQRISRYALGEMAAACMKTAPTMLQATRIDEVDLTIQRAPDCSLDSSRAYALGYEPLSLKAAMQHTVEIYRAAKRS